MVDDYTVEISNRRELSNGSVKYDIVLTHDKSGDVVVDTTYTVSKAQEDPNGRGKSFEEMVETFARKKAKEHSENLGYDHSGKSLSI